MSKKNEKDQYYTKESIALRLSNKIKELFGEDCSYIEPSAGLGAFSKNFEDILSFDIAPKFEGCNNQDFLKLMDVPSKCIFVGNPPFGFSGNLALKFINHCAALKAKAICFILPRTFEKIFFQNKINLNYKLIYNEHVEKNAFILDGKDYNVPCVFQIWEHSDTQRSKVSCGNNNWFVLDNDNPDFCVRRVGGKAGKVLEGLDHSPSSTYFIKGLTPNLKDIIMNLYPKLKDEASKTAGVRSLSIEEIVYILNKNKEQQ